MKSPAFQFYPDDFMGGKPGMMTPEQTHVYVWLLCLEWNQKGFALDEAVLARWCRVSLAVFRRAWPVVSECFTCTDGIWTNERLERERAKQEEFRQKMAENGKKGGRPKKPEGKPAKKPQVSRRLADGNQNESLPSPIPFPVTTTTPTGGAAVAAPPEDSDEEPSTERIPSNWVALFGDDWSSATGGQPAFGKIGAHCKGVVQRYGIAVARPAWQRFCASPERRYGAAYFSEHFGDYNPASGRVVGADGNEAEVLEFLARQSA